MIRALAEKYGYTPAEVGEMTLYQIHMMLVGQSQLGAGTFTVDADDADRVSGSIQASRQLRGMF